MSTCEQYKPSIHNDRIKTCIRCGRFEADHIREEVVRARKDYSALIAEKMESTKKTLEVSPKTKVYPAPFVPRYGTQEDTTD